MSKVSTTRLSRNRYERYRMLGVADRLEYDACIAASSLLKRPCLSVLQMIFQFRWPHPLPGSKTSNSSARYSVKRSWPTGEDPSNAIILNKRKSILLQTDMTLPVRTSLDACSRNEGEEASRIVNFLYFLSLSLLIFSFSTHAYEYVER